MVEPAKKERRDEELLYIKQKPCQITKTFSIKKYSFYISKLNTTVSGLALCLQVA